VARLRPKTPKKWKPGDTITAERLNEMLDLIIRQDLSVSEQSHLSLQQSATGTLLDIQIPAKGMLAIANGAIPARSGSAAGIGSVYLVHVVPTYSGDALSSVALTTGNIAYYGYNPSSTTMTSTSGIDSGQYCWVQYDQNGLLCITPLECT
jgi:hypothetical protein